MSLQWQWGYGLAASMKRVIVKSLKIRDSGTTTKYSEWHFPAKNLWIFQLGVADICRKRCDLKSKTEIPPRPGSGENYRRILLRSFRVAVVKGCPRNQLSEAETYRRIMKFSKTVACHRISEPDKTAIPWWTFRRDR